MADLPKAKRQYERAEAEFTHSIRHEIDPSQEMANNPSDELTTPRIDSRLLKIGSENFAMNTIFTS